MATWITLLRAINLGSHNRVSMPDLRAVLGTAGFGDVRTYVQSGNVVCTSRLRSEQRVSETISTLIHAEFGLDVPVSVRTAQQLAACVQVMPFPAQAVDMPTRTVITFLDAEPDASRVDAFNQADLTPELAAVIGRECYSVHPGGIHQSRMTSAYLRRMLGPAGVGTARNWRTVHALLDLAG